MWTGMAWDGEREFMASGLSGNQIIKVVSRHADSMCQRTDFHLNVVIEEINFPHDFGKEDLKRGRMRRNASPGGFFLWKNQQRLQWMAFWSMMRADCKYCISYLLYAARILHASSLMHILPVGGDVRCKYLHRKHFPSSVEITVVWRRLAKQMRHKSASISDSGPFVMLLGSDLIWLALAHLT